MTYTTLDILVDRYGQDTLQRLTDRATPPAGAIDVEVVNRALADADGVIDGYLAGRYQLPLDQTPPLLADIAASIAIYKLHPRSAPEKIEADYRDALASLNRIAQGVIRLDVAGVEPEASGASGVQATDRARPMTAANLKGFI